MKRYCQTLDLKDDPVLIEYSNRICAGAKDNWEKVFDIYMYVAGEMAYDEAEAADDTSAYQDGAVYRFKGRKIHL